MAGGDDGRQRLRGEFRRSGEDQLHAVIARLLGQLALDPPLLELRQVIDEDLAVQVVDLVLDADRQQAIGFHRPLLAVEVEVFDGDPFGTLDLVVDAGHRQAAFFADLLTAALLQGLGIDEGEQTGSCSSDTSITTTRLCTSTWVAASPMPGASYIVSAMSATSFRMPASIWANRLRDLFQARIGKTQNG